MILQLVLVKEMKFVKVEIFKLFKAIKKLKLWIFMKKMFKLYMLNENLWWFYLVQ